MTSRYTFYIRLEGETWFLPATGFGTTMEKAKEQVEGRYSGRIVEWGEKVCQKSVSSGQETTSQS